jgi:Tfp pilus assembly protein PilO
MAATGIVADFARLPTQRKVMVFVVIGLVLGGVYWRFMYKSLEEDLEAAEAEHQNKKQTNQRLADDIPKYQELRTHMNTLRELIEKNEAALPSEAELAAFIETLQHKVTESGVETKRWTYRTPEPVETFVRVPFEVEMTGTFMQIKRFFASLVQKDVRLSQTPEERASEEHDRIVSIENLALTTPALLGRDVVLTAKFTAVTFRQEDKAATPAKGPGGQPAPAGAKPAAPPPRPATPTVTPPPLPSATPSPPRPTTPAGAKAAVDGTAPPFGGAAGRGAPTVEGAVDKGDARNRNAAGVDEAKAKAGSDRLKGGL